MQQIPDGITPIAAYRAWLLDADGTLRSYAYVNQLAWSNSEWVAARCHRYAEPPHRAPAEGCECGIHAFKSPKDLEKLVRRSCEPLHSGSGDVVAGTVELAGKIIEHARGYRAEWARVVGLLPIAPFIEGRWRRSGQRWVCDPDPVEPDRA